MSIPGLPFQHSIAGATGKAAGQAIAVPGVTADSVLLAVIQYDTDGEIVGTDPADWTAGSGTITSASLNTTGYKLSVIWTDAPQPES